MTVMLSKTYDAFLAAGAPEEKARAAAEELAAYEARFAKIETDLAVLKWMVGVVIGGIVSLFVGVMSLVIKTFANRKEHGMKAETQAVADDIRKSLALLRRHL